MQQEPHYAGFWVRVAASLIDTVLLLILLLPLYWLAIKMGWTDLSMDRIMDPAQSKSPMDWFLSDILPMIIIILFWMRYGGTPGKQMMGIMVVDLRDGGKPKLGQSILRYIGYFIDVLTLFLGVLWVAWDKKKQAFHDKMAQTVVVYGHVESGRDEADKSLEQLMKESR